MKNLLNPNVICTDPDTLQFCLPLSETRFWYCQVNDFNEGFRSETDGVKELIYTSLCGEPELLFDLAQKVIEVQEFISNPRYWFSGDINVTSLTHEEKLVLLQDYGYSWDSFTSEADRNRIICECEFEENILEY